MILSQSLSQPYALAVFALTGASMGIVYGIAYLTAEFWIKKEVFRHIVNVLYIAAYALIFAAIEINIFDYNLHAYHFFVAIASSVLTALALYIPMKAYREKIANKCDKAIEKIRSSKSFKRFTK